MGAVAALWRDRARRRWRSWAVLVLLLAVGAGSGLACLAGARRTASAFDRLADATNYADVASSHGIPPGEAEEVVAGFDGVESHSSQVGFVGFVDDVDPTSLQYFIGSWEKPLEHGVPLLRDGRLPDPDRPEEVLLQGPGPVAEGLRAGDEITFQMFTSDFSSMTSVELVVAGIGDDPFEVAADATYARSAMYFTPAFTDRYAADHTIWTATRFSGAGGKAGEEHVAEQLAAVGWSIDETRSQQHARVQDAIRPLVIVLAFLGGLLLVATMLVIAQSLVRQIDADQPDRETARAVGCSTRQLRLLDACGVLSVTVPAALLGIAIAILLSPLFPTGDIRRLDPHRGAYADAAVLGGGALLVVGALVALGLLHRVPNQRARAVAARPLLGGLGARRPVVTSGVRLAVGGTVPERRRFWATVVVAAGALSLVIGAVGFVASTGGVAEAPARYGAGWDLTTRNAFGDVDPSALEDLFADDADVEGVAAATVDSIRIDGENAPLMPVLPITAELWPTVTDGRVPQDDDEVLVGGDILDAIDAEVGDLVELESPYAAPGEGPSRSATIVGEAVFPAIEMAGVDPTRLGVGVATTYAAFLDLNAVVASPPDFVFLDLREGVDPQDVVDRYPQGMPETSGFSATEWFVSLAPAEVLETDRASGLIWSLVGLIAVTVLASLGHSLGTSARLHERDYLTLRAIGFTPGQVRGAVRCQSLCPVVLAVVVALPVGIALGRSTWRVLARLIGIVDVPTVSALGVALVVAGALLGAVLVAVRPGGHAARTARLAGLGE